MKKNIKTTEAIFPMPALMIATYNDDGTVDVMNAAWGMMLERDYVALNLTESHKTVKNIKKKKGVHCQHCGCETCRRSGLFWRDFGKQYAKQI